VKRSVQLLSLIVVAACTALPPGASRVDVTLANIAPTEVGLLEQQYQVDLRIQNPNDTPMLIDGFSYLIELNGKPFARGVSDQSVSVPRFGEIVVHAKAVSSLTGLVEQIRKLKSGVPDALRYRITGKFALSGGGSMPFDQRGEIGF
jgi:LEA14-like dessication related protein